MLAQLHQTLGNQIILAPGPTETPKWLKDLMITLHHRTKLYQTILDETKEMLKTLFGAPDGIVLVYPGVGRPMMEAVAVNFIRGSSVHIINTGFFADEWEEIISLYGAVVDQTRAEWGRDYSYHETSSRLSRSNKKKVDLVLMQAGDTSTGVRNNWHYVGTLLKSDRPDTLLAVDAVLEAGVSPIKMQHDGIDILVGATQKAFMLPPGLSFIILREKAIKKLANWGCLNPSSFLDLEKELSATGKKYVRFTHPTSHISALWALLKTIFEEVGEDNWYQIHTKRAQDAREKFTSLGFKNFTRGSRSNGVSVLLPPEEKTIEEILRAMETRGFILAGGIKPLNDKVIRMSHFLGVEEKDLDRFFVELERYLKSA